MKPTVLAAAIGGACALCAAAAAVTETPAQRVLVHYRAGARPAAEASVLERGGRINLRLLKQGVVAVTLPANQIQSLRSDPDVLSVEPDPIRFPMAQSVPYGVTAVQAPSTWAAGVTGDGIKVCVIDSGINAQHEDFTGVAMSGYPTGWNTDSCGHGTHVAGTIAAANNSTGVVGVSPGRVSLHIIKVFNGANCGWSYASSLVDAANRCADAGAKVINMSLGGPDASETERTAFDNLYNTRGVLSIAAAGNDGDTSLSYPASYDSVVSVAAVDSANAHADFSQANAPVEIAAPGVAVLSTYPMRSASVSVATTRYAASAMSGSMQGTANATIVNGGRCTSAGAWSGKVVVCERGDISFADKTANVTAGGGVAAVVYNNVPGGFQGTLGAVTSTIPALSLSREDGLVLVRALGRKASVTSVAQTGVSAYDYLDGTSMATPHVAGAAALVWSAVPNATNAQVRAALTSTALDLGTAGRDTQYGYGLVRTFKAVEALLAATPTATTPSALTVQGAGTDRLFNRFSLSWTGGGGLVDVWRGATSIARSTSNARVFVDRALATGTGSFAYKVCNAGTTNCSNVVSISY